MSSKVYRVSLASVGKIFPGISILEVPSIRSNAVSQRVLGSIITKDISSGDIEVVYREEEYYDGDLIQSV